jgi:hypothetical protein
MAESLSIAAERGAKKKGKGEGRRGVRLQGLTWVVWVLRTERRAGGGEGPAMTMCFIHLSEPGHVAKRLFSHS